MNSDEYTTRNGGGGGWWKEARAAYEGMYSSSNASSFSDRSTRLEGEIYINNGRHDRAMYQGYLSSPTSTVASVLSSAKGGGTSPASPFLAQAPNGMASSLSTIPATTATVAFFRSELGTPSDIVKRNTESYHPQTVSIGPYHYGKPHLKAMEEHKNRALRHLLHRTGKPAEEFMAELKKVAKELMDSYEQLDEEWVKDEERFAQLMLQDGSFFLEFRGRKNGKGGFDTYAPNDPIFREMPHLTLTILEDLMMLENQLPGLVLSTILRVGGGPEQSSEVGNGEGHYLRRNRWRLIGNANTAWEYKFFNQRPKVRRVTDYHKAGVQFRCTKTFTLADLAFDPATDTLKLPQFFLGLGAESRYLNLVAFERLHVETRHTVSSYLWMFFEFIRSAEDVALLQANGVIMTQTSSEAVLDDIRKLSRDINFVPYKLHLPFKAMEELEKFYQTKTNKWNRRFREWRLHLQQTYFRNPWTLISVVAAFILLDLTVTQTIYSALSYYRSNK
ncbi:hypothetical protein H6P81_004848 [Aristolochia fimbriata]|uniref:Uncharacterized protein n=1 Tax=Aristolochia fimbriata TaxID=158543 RepID=A0AAV7EU84_ARIFI|nr:hypothetical protein H6P81_004848 [Aristolochia fimbriata]